MSGTYIETIKSGFKIRNHTLKVKSSLTKATLFDKFLIFFVCAVTNDTLVELTSRKNNEEESKDVHKVVHQRRGVYGGADLLRKGPKKNGANYIFEKPILVSSFFLFLFVAFTL